MHKKILFFFMLSITGLTFTVKEDYFTVKSGATRAFKLAATIQQLGSYGESLPEGQWTRHTIWQGTKGSMSFSLGNAEGGYKVVFSIADRESNTTTRAFTMNPDDKAIFTINNHPRKNGLGITRK